MGVQERQSSEKTIFQDPKTGRTIWRLTNSQREDKHTYYDICPWSYDQKYIVFSSADLQDLTIQRGDNLATHNGELYVMDTENYEIRKVAEPTLFTTHNGAFALWHPRKHQVYFYQAPHKVGVVDVATAKLERTMEGGIRQLSPDGKRFATSSNDPSFREGRGVYTMDEDGSDVHRIVSTEELYERTPNKDRFALDDMTVGNTKWTPDGQHMLVAMWVHPTPQVRRSIYIVSRDGTEKRWLTYMGHHHSWARNGEQVLYSGYKQYTDDGVREEPRLYLINFDGSDDHVVIEEPLGGHPIMNPAGTMITTWDRQGVILVRVEEQKVEYLTSFEPGFDMSHAGTHPHCVWSPDGTQILYNSAQTGHSQLYIIPMQE
jgi:WD40 repeat protein